MDIIEKQLGEFIKVDAKTVDGKLVAEAAIDIGGLLDFGAAKVKAAIPGQIDDVVIDLLIKELKSQLLGVSDPAQG